MMKLLEKLEIKTSLHGGKRDGSGMKKGQKTKKTLEKEAALEAFRARTRKHIDKLYNSQFNLATGVTYVYEIVETGEGKNKRRENVLVTSFDRIKEVLDEIGEDGSGNVDKGYYFITTVKPDNKAIDSMMDRTFGKSQQNVDLKSGGKELLKLTQEDVIDSVKNLSNISPRVDSLS